MQVQSRRSASGSRQCLDLEMPAVSDALTDVRSAFADLPVPASALDDARLLVSELVANSMRHARLGPNDTIRVAVEVENGTLFHVRPASLETHVPFGTLAFAAA